MDRVLVVVSSISNCGGVSTVVKNICQALYEKNIICDFITYDKPNSEDSEMLNAIGSNVFITERFSKVMPHTYIKNLRKIMRNHQTYIAMFSHISLFTGFACYAGKRENIPIRIGYAHGAVMTNYSYFFKFTKRFFEWFSRKNCTHMLACSQKSGEYDFKSGFLLFSNFIDLDRIFNYSKEKVEEFKKQLDIPNSAKIIGSAGRIGWLKNTRFVVEVFNELHKINQSVYLLLIGDGSEDDVNEVKSLIADENLDEFVKLPGYFENMDDIKHIFNVYINTSLSEGMSLSILDAQACGIPCVVSNGVPDTNDAGLPLYFKCNTFQVNEWVDKVSRALEKNIKISEKQIMTAFETRKMDKESGTQALLDIMYTKGENSYAGNNVK